MSDARSIARSNFEFEYSECLDDALGDIRKVLLNGDYILSKYVSEFERRFASFVGCRHGIGVNSGTDAIMIALRSLGIGPGDEVITVANTFHATALAAAAVGARVSLVDAREGSFLIDVDAVENAITSATRAVVVVHLYGLLADLGKLREICRAHKLRLVEDCAQATGARTADAIAGSGGDIACFSFHPSKNLAAAGDAGIITTDQPDLAERCRSLRYFGQRQRKVHSELGYNSKLDAIQSILLAHKLPYLDDWNRKRVEAARRYRAALTGYPVRFQDAGSDLGHVYHLFQIRLADEATRDGLLACLRAQGVDAVVRYPAPIHLQPAFSDLGYGVGDFPVAEALAQTLLCLPIRPDLTQVEIAHIARCIGDFFGHE